MIAEKAGVSTATVDRVLNGRTGVGKATALKVQKAAQELKFRPDPAAQALSRRSRLNLDIILPSGTNTFISGLSEHIEEANDLFAHFKVTARRHLVESFRPELLADKIMELCETSDGIALIAIDHPLVREAIAEAAKKEIPIVTLISDITRASRIGYVGIDNRMAGRTAGYLMGRMVRDPVGEVALIAGSLSYRGHEEREMGFRRLLQEEFPGLKVVALVEGLDDVDKSFETACGVLDSYPNLKGIYSIGGGTSGVAMALETKDRGDDVVFIGHELTSKARKYLVAGPAGRGCRPRRPLQAVAGGNQLIADEIAVVTPPWPFSLRSQQPEAVFSDN